jgi:hypothetical protein
MSTLEELHDDIVGHRQELAATVDALAQKLDVKARAAERWQQARPVAVQALAAAALLVTGLALVRRSKP